MPHPRWNVKVTSALALRVPVALLALQAGASARNYKVEFLARASSVSAEPSPFSCEVRLVHDVFFGEPTVRATAKACQAADGTPIKSPPVYACYDIVQADVRRATRCDGPLIAVDVAGSPNWGALFPGLSAADAKALVKAGFTIANVRLSAKPLKAEAPAAGAASTAPSAASAPTPPAAEAVPPPASAGDAAATPPARCTPPSLGPAGGPWAACLSPIVGSTNQPVLTSDGVRHGLAPVASEVEWRREGASTWRSTTDSGLVARPRLDADPCRAWEVRARTSCDDGSVSPWSPILRMTTTCPAPSAVRTQPAGGSAVRVDWRTSMGFCQEVEGVTAQLQLSQANGPWQDVVTPNGGLIEGLTPGKRYALRVRFVFPEGAQSEWKGATFTAPR